MGLWLPPASNKKKAGGGGGGMLSRRQKLPHVVTLSFMLFLVPVQMFSSFGTCPSVLQSFLLVNCSSASLFAFFEAGGG